MSDPERLYGLKALVTSAASGIGEAVARTFVKNGATVLAVDAPSSALEQQLAGVAGIDCLPASIGDARALPGIIDTAVERLGALDIVVNDYPLHVDGPVHGVDEDFGRLLDARAALISAASRAAIPHLQKSPAGRIINVGLLRTVFAADAQAACAHAEKKLADLTLALAAEAGEFGITANYVQPGAIMTPASRRVFSKDTALRDFCIANCAAKRLGEPIDVARVVLFLASDDAMFVSGIGITVDGGPPAS